MRLLLIALLSTLGAVSLALIVREDPGYVLIGYGDWTVEMALSLFALFLLVGFALVYAVLRTLIRLWRLPAQTRAWNVRRRQRSARRALTQGLLELDEGRWAQAEKRLVRSARFSDAAILNYLGAARAAQHQDAGERRDVYLRHAAEAMPADMPGAELALGVTRAELHIAAEQWEQARATLAELRERAPKHRQVLALSARVLAGLDDWEAIAPLLPELRRQKVLTEAELGALTVTVRAAQLTSRGDGPREAFEAFWLSLPKADRQHPALLERYLDRLPAEQADKGLELLREVLKKRWEPSLLGRYAGLRGSNPGQQFQLAEAWLAGHERDPALLLVLGRLARRAGLWGKARSYLETSLGIAPVAEAYRHLGEVLLEMGDAEGAARRFREGLETLTGGIEPAPARFQPALRALPADASDPALAELQALSRVSAA